MCFANWLLKCLHWPFCPGVFIAILGFLAAAVTFRKEPGPREKAAWTFLFLVLMCAEVMVMSKDRDEHDKQQAQASKEEADHFQMIATGIQQSIEQSKRDFDSTMGQFIGVAFKQRLSGSWDKRKNAYPKNYLKCRYRTCHLEI